MRLERLTFIKRSSIKKSSRLSQTKKKKKKTKKKKANPKTQTPYFTLTSTTSLQLHSHTDQNTIFQTLASTSSLQLHIHTDQNTVFQINKHTKREIPKGSGKKKGSVCLLQQGKLKNLVRPLQKQAIQKIIQKVGMFFSPFFCFLFNYRF